MGQKPWLSSHDLDGQRQRGELDRQSPGNLFVPQISVSVRLVSAFALGHCESLTALAHGPSTSNRHNSQPTSIVWPDGLNTMRLTQHLRDYTLDFERASVGFRTRLCRTRLSEADSFT